MLTMSSTSADDRSGALTLLAAATDPAGTESRLKQIIEATEKLEALQNEVQVAQQANAKQKAEAEKLSAQATAEWDRLESDRALFDAKVQTDALSAAATKAELDGLRSEVKAAAAAVTRREKAVYDRSIELDTREAATEAKKAELDAREHAVALKEAAIKVFAGTLAA